MLKNFKVAPDLHSNLYHKVNAVQRRGELRYVVTDFKKEDRVLLEVEDKDGDQYKIAVLGGQWCSCSTSTSTKFEILVFMWEGEDEDDPWIQMEHEVYRDVGEVQAALYHLFNALADGDRPSLPYFDEDEFGFPPAPEEVCHVL